MKSRITATGGRDPKKLMSLVIDVFNHHKLPVMRELTWNLANDFREELRFRIASQAFNHRPLDPDYRAEKVAEGLDPRILISSREYLDSIQVRPIPDGTGYYVGVGEGIHQGSGLPMRVLARILEFGSKIRGIPARPHWRPMAAIYRLKTLQLAKDSGYEILRRVRNQLKKH